MALSIRTNSHFTHKLRSLTAPSLEGLVAEYVFHESAEKSANSVSGLQDYTLIGTPTFTSNSITIGSGIGIETPYNFNSFTMILVLKINSMGRFTNTNPSELLGYLNYEGKVNVYNNNSSSGSNMAQLDVPTNGGYNFYCARLPYYGKASQRCYFDGVLQTATATINGGDRTGSVIQFGNGGGSQELAYGALYNYLLTDDEIDAAYQALKTYYADEFTI